MKLDEIKANYIYYTEIDLGGGDFVKLREPAMQELNELNSKGRSAESLAGLFPSCLVDHSFIDEDGGKAAPGRVYEELKESGSLFTEILSVWLEKIPFQHRLRKEPK
jgi:hypothetical protein